MGQVIPFPPVYRIGYSDGDVCGLVEDKHGLAISFRRPEKAEAALKLLRLQYPGIVFWVTYRPNQ